MPSKADVKAWKAQLVAQAEQQILKLTDSDRFKQYLNTLAKFHHYSARNIDLIYVQNPQATQVAGFKQWQTALNRTVKRGAKAIRIAAPIIKKLTPAEQKRLDTTDERAIVGYRYLPVFDVSQASGEPDNALKLKTLYHEYAHSQLHALKSAFKDRPRAYQETQAEAVAYVAMQNTAVKGTFTV
ncbi:ArdC-like ssDNA-binding domain-containing protein, partial [Companilactobacillus bobalius]